MEAARLWGNFGGNRNIAKESCPQMALTDSAVRAAKPLSYAERQEKDAMLQGIGEGVLCRSLIVANK